MLEQFFDFSNTSSICSMAMPNLFSAKPVVMFACVCAPTLGFILNAIFAVFPILQAISLITCISASLSTLKHAMSFRSPSSISQSLLPTPAYTILELGNPAFTAASISPPLTQSAPNDALLMIFSNSGLALALMA